MPTASEAGKGSMNSGGDENRARTHPFAAPACAPAGSGGESESETLLSSGSLSSSSSLFSSRGTSSRAFAVASASEPGLLATPPDRPAPSGTDALLGSRLIPAGSAREASLLALGSVSDEAGFPSGCGGEGVFACAAAGAFGEPVKVPRVGVALTVATLLVARDLREVDASASWASGSGSEQACVARWRVTRRRECSRASTPALSPAPASEA